MYGQYALFMGGSELGQRRSVTLRFKWVLGLLLLLVVLNGCNAIDKSQEPVLSGEISILIPGYSTEYQSFWQDVSEAFSERYPQAKVKPMFMAFPNRAQFEQMEAEGMSPDLMMGEAVLFREMNKSGLLKDLDSLADVEGVDLSASFEPALLESIRQGERLHLIPSYVSTPVVLYHKPTFAERQIEVSSEAWTWEAFADVIRGLKEEDRATQVLFPAELSLLSPLVMSNGGTMSSDGHTFSGYLDAAPSVDAIAWYVDLVQRGWVQHENQRNSIEMIRSGEAAMWVSPGWYLASDEQVGALPLPYFENGEPVVNSTVYGISMSESTRNPALAWAFLQFVLFERNALMDEMPTGFYPWGISRSHMEAMSEQEGAQVLQRSLPLVREDWQNLNPDMWHISWRKIDYFLKTTLLQKEPLSEQLSELARMIDQELQQVASKGWQGERTTK